MRRLTTLSSACALAALASVATAAPLAAHPEPISQYGKTPAKQAPSAPPSGVESKAPASVVPPAEAKYYDKLDPADREALQANVGYLMPAPAGQLEWIGGDALMAADFRGKVTVIQSLGGRAGGRALAEKVKKLLPEGVMLLGLHTPEGADKAQGVFGQNPPCLIAVDRNGEWCDALGIWKRPVNLVIDKTGAVRFVGLSDLGLKSKLEALLAEEVDDSVVAKTKPDVVAKPVAASDAPTAWPTFTNAVGGIDVRGKTLPQFVVQKWITRQPDPAGRLVAIDFWATWCPPCRASIPHLNEIQAKFGNDILVVGVSDETSSKFEQGLKKQDLKESQFQYSLALDPAQRMYKFFGPGGIPHMAILSPDMVVRWQGHPATLQDADLQKLVDANRALSKTAANSGGGQRGWVKGTSPTAR